MIMRDTASIWKTRLRGKPRSNTAAAVLKLLKAFEKSQWWMPEKIAARQFTQLSRLLAHSVATVPHYADLLASHATRDAASLMTGAWHDLPTLKRETVNRLGDALLSTAIPSAHGASNVIHTSGTTGQPVRVVRTHHALHYWSAFTARDHIWHDRDIKGTLAAIRSSEKGFATYPHGARHEFWGMRDAVFKTGPSVSLNVNTPIPDMAEWIARMAPDYLLSMPNVIKRLAPYCIERGVEFPSLKGIQVIGEECGAWLRGRCRAAWNLPVQDVYTSREIGYMALQCPVHDHYHVQSEGVYMEILDEDNRPCRPGEIGRVVVTPLHNYAMPLIRYEIGDYAQLGPPCDCGRGLPVVTRILGREQDILVLPTGEERWTLLGEPDVQQLMELAPISQYQLAHVAPDAIEVRLAARRDVTAAAESAIADWVCKKLGYPFTVAFAYVDEIPRTAAGKFRDFVVEFNGDRG